VQVRGARDRGGPWADLPPCRRRGSRVRRRRFEVREALPQCGAGSGRRGPPVVHDLQRHRMPVPGLARRATQVRDLARPRGRASGRSAGAFRGRGRYDNSWDISDQRLTSSTGSSLSFSATPAARTCSRNCTPRSPGNRSRPRRNLRTCWTMTPRPSEPRGPCLKAAPLGLQLPAGRTGPGKAAARAPGAVRPKNRCLCHDRT
jgi:hypothetical protein